MNSICYVKFKLIIELNKIIYICNKRVLFLQAWHMKNYTIIRTTSNELINKYFYVDEFRKEEEK